jgi:hypothetical protein
VLLLLRSKRIWFGRTETSTCRRKKLPTVCQGDAIVELGLLPVNDANDSELGSSANVKTVGPLVVIPLSEQSKSLLRSPASVESNEVEALVELLELSGGLAKDKLSHTVHFSRAEVVQVCINVHGQFLRRGVLTADRVVVTELTLRIERSEIGVDDFED